MRWWVLLLVLVPSLTWSTPRSLLALDIPHTEGEPRPDALLVTILQGGQETPDTLRMVASLPGACHMVVDATPDTYCAFLPHCLGEGSYLLTAQAVYGERISNQSPPLLCQVSTAHPCQCTLVPNAGLASPQAGVPVPVNAVTTTAMPPLADPHLTLTGGPGEPVLSFTPRLPAPL